MSIAARGALPAAASRPSPRCSRARALAATVLLLLGLSGCSTLGYYSGAVVGHLEVMQATRPIASLIDDPECDPELRMKLAEVRRIRDFASRELGLPDNGSYRTYADIKRPFVSWNVVAAPEFSLQTVNWCMFVVGCVGYRGFHDESAAQRLAGELRAQGFDTYVGGVPAYSTLGYLSDPVLNTFLAHGSFEVARVIFHELAHQVVFVEGDTVFNESFATAVENEGLRRWMAHRKIPDNGSVAAQNARKSAFVKLVGTYRVKLAGVYASDLPADAKRLAKSELFAEIRRSYLEEQQAKGHLPVFKEWLERDFNNAKIASLGLYTQMLAGFEALLKAEHYDLERFYRSVEKLARMSFNERRVALEAVEGQSERLTASR